MSGAKFQAVDISEVMLDLRELTGLNAESPSDLLKALEGLANLQWTTIDEWEDMSDISLLDILVPIELIHGEVFVIDEASYREGRGAFRMESINLRYFAENHLRLFGECLFNGDTFFFFPKSRKMTVFHHDGAWANISLANGGQVSTQHPDCLSKC